MHSGQIKLLIDSLVKYLFKAEDLRLRKREIELVAENRKLSDQYYDGFFYQGKYYTDLDPSMASKGIKSGLNLSLAPIMEKHVADNKEIDFDKVRVRQALTLILKDCKTAQDLRDALPNQLAELIDQVKVLKRLRPEGFTVMGDPRKFKQYQMLREKIEFYTAAKLLY